LTEIGTLRAYGRVRGEIMSGPPPASTAVEVAALALPGWWSRSTPSPLF